MNCAIEGLPQRGDRLEMKKSDTYFGRVGFFLYICRCKNDAVGNSPLKLLDRQIKDTLTTKAKGWEQSRQQPEEE